MPFVSDFTLPESANRLPLDSNTALFVAFISSNDPVTKQPWCPDVRAALPRLHAAFSGADAPKLAVVEVGQKPE